MTVKRLLELLNIRYPIIQGGMGNISSGELCAAVSEAGGLGQIGAGTLPPEELRARIETARRLTDKPFAVNLPLSVHPDLARVVDVVLETDVPVISLSAGNPVPWIPLFKERGRRVMVTVASVRQAKKAAAAGADVLVAEGVEAAGKNAPLELTTMTLIPQIASAVRVPVVAAGGIADARGFVAALALGASGVQMGTRFVATKEARVHDRYKEALVAAADTDTVVVGRSVGRVTRLLATPYARMVSARERDGLTEAEFDRLTSEESHVRGAIEGRLEEGHVNAGQIVGLVTDVPTVREVIARIVAESGPLIEQLAAAWRTLGTPAQGGNER